ncbi:MAG: oligoribonuclease [Pseudomonadota bacterium]
MAADPENLIWIDLEMTGLDSRRDKIIEIATLVTDKHLNTIAEGPVITVHQSDEVLAGMDEWNTRQHGQSGLTARVRTSRLNEFDAQRETLIFLNRHTPAGASPMCGNSICQDRRFLAESMPELESFFHYRNLDVSTIKELVRRWAPDLAKGLKKKSTHLAMEDIRESIEELEYYRNCFFKL